MMFLAPLFAFWYLGALPEPSVVFFAFRRPACPWKLTHEARASGLRFIKPVHRVQP